MSAAASSARPRLEALLCARKLDGALTTALRFSARRESADLIPTEFAPLDAHLGGGFARGEVSEIVGPDTSGRTSLYLRTIAAATRHGERVAVVDALDRLDIASARASGVELDQLLWIRGMGGGAWMPRSGHARRALDQSVKALMLVLQARVCGLVIFDIADAPPAVVRSLPFTTWMRVHRTIEGSRTACILVAGAPLWRSPAGLTVRLKPDSEGPPSSPLPSHARLLDGRQISAAVHRPHGVSHEPVCLPLATVCA
jgi:hypothetical protein